LDAARENAVAAICRIIYTYNPPLPINIFVNNMMNMLPFKGIYINDLDDIAE
jgi:hypothetical protein